MQYLDINRCSQIRILNCYDIIWTVRFVRFWWYFSLFEMCWLAESIIFLTIMIDTQNPTTKCTSLYHSLPTYILHCLL